MGLLRFSFIDTVTADAVCKPCRAKKPHRREVMGSDVFERKEKSLVYTGIDKHTGEDVGLYSTVISREDYDAMAGQLAASMEADQPG